MPNELALTTEEQRQLLDLLDPNAEIEVVIPETIDSAKLMSTLGLCCKVSVITRRQATQSDALIGRMLYIIRERTIFREWGFTSFTGFVEDWVKPRMGKGQTSVYDALRIAKSFPSITPARYEKIGPVKLNILQKFTDETKPSVEEHMKRAEILSVADFRRDAEERKLISKGEATLAIINFATTHEVAHMFKKLIHDAKTIEVCGTEDTGLILMHLMEEWAGEYGVDLS